MTHSRPESPASGMGMVRALLVGARQMTRINLGVSIWVVFSFAIAQPLLDLLGRNPEFFLARAAPGIDIVLVAVLLLFVIPALLALLVVGIRTLLPTVGLIAHGVLFIVIAAALVVSLLARTPAGSLSGWAQIAVGLIIGAALWGAYVRFTFLRTTFRFAAFGPFVFLLAFLVFSPTSSLLRASGSVDRPAGVEVGNPAPVVMVVFDEFPLASLIDSTGQIIEDAYPNFARLASDGVWFRNAMAVEQQTEHALPAILTGRHPVDRDAIPITADYPLTLFSLLSDAYEIKAVESVTELCPAYACSNRTRIVSSASERWPATATDLGIVTAHTILPSDLTEDLPSISNTWGNFATAEARDDFNIIRRFNEHVDADRRSQVERFIDLLEEPSDQPTLHYAHVLLPHIPWSYLETGQSYRTDGRAAGSTPGGWGPDEWLVMQAYQRHLIQVQYTDHILGRLIETLEENGTYDDSLVIVVGDHGTADIPNIEHRRVITPQTVGHVAAVPLFMKLPNQETTGIDDYRAETIDILPTITDVLDVQVPWRVDGTSLVSSGRPERTSTTMRGPDGNVTFDTSGTEKLEVARWKEEWFVSGSPYSLTPPGYGNLLETPLEEASTVTDGSLTVRLDHPEWYTDVDLSSDPFPARLTGTLSSSSRSVDDAILAVSLNGHIEAVVRAYDEDGTTRFQAMLPPDAFQSGDNGVHVLLVRGSGPEQTLVQPVG